MTKEEFSVAYQNGLKYTHRFLVSRGLSQDMAYDVSQAAWVCGWEQLEQLKNPASIAYWINTIAINIHRSKMRKLRKEDCLEKLIEPQTTSLSNLSTIEVERTLKLCRPQDQAVLIWYCLEGLGTAEISELTGWTRSAIRIRLLRARRNFAAKLLVPKTQLLDSSQVELTEDNSSQGDKMADQVLKLNLSPGMKAMVAGDGVAKLRSVSTNQVVLMDIAEIKRMMAAPDQFRVANLQALVILQGMGRQYLDAVKEYCTSRGVTETKYVANRAELTRWLDTVGKEPIPQKGGVPPGPANPLQPPAQPAAGPASQPAPQPEPPPAAEPQDGTVAQQNNGDPGSTTALPKNSPDASQPNNDPPPANGSTVAASPTSDPPPPADAPEPPPPANERRPDDPPRPTLISVLANLESIYAQCGGDSGKIISHVRMLGINDKAITNGNLYQRINAIRKRRGDAVPARGRHSSTRQTQLLDSTKAKELGAAIATLQATMQQVLILAAAVTSENETLQKAAAEQAETLKLVPAMQAELVMLREKVSKARTIFAEL